MKPLFAFQNTTWHRALLFSLLIPIAIVFTACHVAKDELPEPVANTEIVAEQRCIADCSECPRPNYCCVIQLISDVIMDFELCGNFIGCGTSTSCGPINAPAPCGTISGISEVTGIMQLNSLYHFCIAGSEEVYIFNSNPSVTARINVYCFFADSTDTPNITSLQIEPQSGAFLEIGGYCLTSECD